jgi:hypothetical protein
MYKFSETHSEPLRPLLDELLPPILPIMLDGKLDLSEEHIALMNHDAVNHLIRRERRNEHPLGTDFNGANYLMIQRGLHNPYICTCQQFPDGHFVILCMMKEQSELFFQSYELQANKTFSRTQCQELELNTFSHSVKRTATLARVFTNYEDGEGYFEAFSLSFKTAEKVNKLLYLRLM